MTFDEYTDARRSRKYGIAVDDDAITRFESSQPKACPVCGAQVFDPFAMKIVIHDIDRCAAKRPNQKGKNDVRRSTDARGSHREQR